MTRLLVTGASGLLGSNFVLQAKAEYEVIAASYRTPVSAPGVTARCVDLTDPELARSLVAEVQPEWIVHCAAATDVDACQADPAWAFRLNRDASASLAHVAGNAAFVYISTDCVFDGQAGGYDEKAIPAPVNIYGEAKLAGERAVLRGHPGALIVRTNIFGWNAQAKTSLAEWFLTRAESGQPSPGWTDVLSTPILVNDLVEIILALLKGGNRGVYHVGGGTCLSKWEFGRRVLTTFGLSPEQVEAAHVADAELLAPRGRNLCLEGGKVERALGRSLPPLGEGLARFRRLREEGWVERLREMVDRRGTESNVRKEVGSDAFDADRKSLDRR